MLLKLECLRDTTGKIVVVCFLLATRKEPVCNWSSAFSIQHATGFGKLSCVAKSPVGKVLDLSCQVKYTRGLT